MIEIVIAYAKINLHLDICTKRADGYHDVETVMQSVSLRDTISVTPHEACEFTCECNVEGVPTDEKNIAVRAAKLYAEKTGMRGGAHIEIEKNIPMAAGLAGGSTDAAATLVALNRINGSPLDENKLCELASTLGADVPFCISGGCSYSDGKGDVLHAFPQIPADTVFVVACGGEGVSTPWAYKLMDASFNDFLNYRVKGTGDLHNVLLSDRPENFYKHIFNVFEVPIFEQRPVAKEIKAVMLNGGALNAMMSGSGPSVFGIFNDAVSAQKITDEIRKLGFFAAVCYPVAKREI